MVTLLTAVICLQAASVLALLPDRTTRANRGGCERRFLQQLTSRDTGHKGLMPGVAVLLQPTHLPQGPVCD